jgi:hypothetical protein
MAYNPYCGPQPHCPQFPPVCFPSYPTIAVGTGATGSTGPTGAQSTVTGPTGPTGSKTFVIDHPVKPDNYLVHACLEGAEAGVYYRGTTQVCDKFVEVTLPNYVDALANNFTVHVTPIFDEDNIEENGTYKVTDVKDGKFKIYGPKGSVNWIVYGSRGEIEVEPLKSSVNVKGDGPYKYI